MLIDWLGQHAPQVHYADSLLIVLVVPFIQQAAEVLRLQWGQLDLLRSPCLYALPGVTIVQLASLARRCCASFCPAPPRPLKLSHFLRSAPLACRALRGCSSQLMVYRS